MSVATKSTLKVTAKPLISGHNWFFSHKAPSLCIIAHFSCSLSSPPAGNISGLGTEEAVVVPEDQLVRLS